MNKLRDREKSTLLNKRIIDKWAVEVPAEVLTQIENDEEIVVLLDVVRLLLALLLINVVLVAVDSVNERLPCVVFALEVLSADHDWLLEEDVLIGVEDDIFEKEWTVGDHFQGLVVADSS